jgi:uncharacterized protein (TIGR03435 family)
MIAGLLTTGLAGAQTFEVASIKPDAAGNAGGEASPRESVSYNPGGLTMRNVTLKSCIRWAYGVEDYVEDYQVSGPAWIASERFDIDAKAAAPSTEEQLRLMLRALLASRFQLRLHRETKEMAVYDLVAGKSGPKLTPAAGEGASRMRPTGGELIYSRYSMPEFAETLTGIPFRLDRTVVDKTGLTGTYDFRLKIAADAAAMKSGFEHAEGPLVFDILILQQIGLRLEPRKGAVEVLTVDGAEKNPTAN